MGTNFVAPSDANTAFDAIEALLDGGRRWIKGAHSRVERGVESYDIVGATCKVCLGYSSEWHDLTPLYQNVIGRLAKAIPPDRPQEQQQVGHYNDTEDTDFTGIAQWIQRARRVV